MCARASVCIKYIKCVDYSIDILVRKNNNRTRMRLKTVRVYVFKCLYVVFVCVCMYMRILFSIDILFK